MTAAQAQDFSLAAKNAARDITTDEARSEARRIAQDLVPPHDMGEPLYRMCKSIREALLALPELPVGTRGYAAVGLQHLARTVDLILRLASAKADGAMSATAQQPKDELDEERIPYRPGVDD